MSTELIREKIKNYCAYQERCHMEVVDKLYKLGLHKSDVDQLVLMLIQDNFLNEERFAEAYVSGKFRIKRWGRVKIKTELKRKRISDYCIKKGMAVIDDDEYIETLRYWLERRKTSNVEKNQFKRKGKIASFLLSKGFESWLVWEELNKE